MTLIGPRSAVVSLGLSRQTSFQLFKNKDLVSRLLDETMEYQSNFFNWMMSDIEGVASFIKAFSGNTLSPGDIVRDESREWRTGPLQVGNHRIWLWHARKCKDTSDEDLARFTMKYAYLLKKFSALRSKNLRIFIVSNSQNNLNQTMDREHFRFVLTPSRREAIENAVNEAFPAGINRFLYAVYPRRVEGLELEPDSYYPIPTDGSEWEGDESAWARFLSTTIPKCRERHFGSKIAWNVRNWRCTLSPIVEIVGRSARFLP